jgi:Transcriptional Coactivator p15 (PC4)
VCTGHSTQRYRLHRLWSSAAIHNQIYIWYGEVQGQIEAFITKQASDHARGVSAKKRPAPAETSALQAANKAVKAELQGAPASVPTPATPSEGVFLTGGGLQQCNVREFKGKLYVNLRNYYKVGLS